MDSITPYEIYLTDSYERMGIFRNYKAGGTYTAPYEGKLSNSHNYDLGDMVEFESNLWGWQHAQVVRVAKCPIVDDEYEMEFILEDGTLKREYVEGRYLQ